MYNFRERNIIVAITGSIAAYKAAGIISDLKKSGANIKVVATPSALQFVGKATFEGLSGEPIASDLWESGKTMEHISLGKWADALLICPATAHSLNSLAVGLGDGLLGNLFLAWPNEKPVVVCPAMNTRMWTHFSTQKSIEVLKENGIHFVLPEEGLLACGEQGQGRLAPETQILKKLESRLSASKKLGHFKILLTYGGTKVPIDSVRHIGNFSSGKTGQILADALAQTGASIFCLRSDYAPQSKMAHVDLAFDYFDDFQQKLEATIKKYRPDVVIHLAAVSDYSVEKPSVGKISSGKQGLELRLIPTPKILPKIKQWSDSLVIGFKLTSGTGPNQRAQAVKKIFDSGDVDYVVENDLSEIQEGRHPFKVWDSEMEVVGFGQTKKELGLALTTIIGRNNDTKIQLEAEI